MNNNIYIKLLESLSKTNDPNYKRSLLYSTYSTLILSKEHFNHNSDLQPFVESLLSSWKSNPEFKSIEKKLHFGDYVFKSRSIVISRIIRIIEIADENQLDILESTISNSIKELYPRNSKQTNMNKKKPRVNQVDKLFNRFERK